MRDPNATVAGVRFRNAGKIFYFHAAGMRLDVGEHVVVETTRGPEIARVVISPDQVVVNELGREELKPILRLATDEDIEKMDRLKQRAEQILPEARQIASDTRFPAQLDGAEFTLDGKRITFSFTSEDRLDYRDFIRRAGERFGTKVDMRQMGARDRAKLAGGYGICGRELCCSSWLSAFPSISIRMAKEQDLPLNPQKISGLCGRLLCCLSYEEEGYKEMRKTLPKIGQRCSTPTGEGKVIGINILRRQVTLLVQGQRIEVPDRDLGLVVRWDTASKAGDPPPSISRADAIEQGLIEATEDDILAAARAAQDGEWLPQEVEAAPGPGRGRLPGGGPRKEIRNRPPKGPAPVPGVGSATGRRRGGRGATPPGEERGSQQGGDTQQPRRARNEGARRERAAGPPEGRVFQRSVPPTREVDSRPAEPLGTNGPTPLDGADGSTAGTPRARRGRGRRGRGSSGGGIAPQP
jgi:cell fate regulator YaaT (PSP1 superfamily)